MKRVLFIFFIALSIALQGQVMKTPGRFPFYTPVGLDSINAILRDGNTFAWYDATDESTLTIPTGDSVTVWADKLGSGNDLDAQVNTRPTWTDTAGVYFDGTHDRMLTGVLTYNQPHHIYLVIKQVTWTANLYLMTSSDGTPYIQQRTATPNIRISAGTASANNANLAVGAWGIVRIKFDGESSSLQVNATTATTGDYGTDTMSGVCFPGMSTLQASIKVKEAIFRKVIDSEANESIVYNYLKTKYGL